MWDYTRDEYSETVVSQFNLVCKKDYWRSLSSSIYMTGIMFGSFFSGFLSDMFGRKKVTLVFALGCLAFGIAVSFAESMEVFTFLRYN